MLNPRVEVTAVVAYGPGTCVCATCDGGFEGDICGSWYGVVIEKEESNKSAQRRDQVDSVLKAAKNAHRSPGTSPTSSLEVLGHSLAQ